MGLRGQIPPQWWAIEFLREVLAFVRELQVDREDRKTLVWEWAGSVGYKLTREDYISAGAEILPGGEDGE